jgi:hypothetical protein
MSLPPVTTAPAPVTASDLTGQPSTGVTQAIIGFVLLAVIAVGLPSPWGTYLVLTILIGFFALHPAITDQFVGMVQSIGTGVTTL